MRLTLAATVVASSCLATILPLPVIAPAPASAQTAPPVQARPRDPLDLAIGKSNAYVALMNRTIRAVEAWERYRSWVNLKTGPTGRERYITYGIYSLYDVRGEIEKALAATTAEPAVPELDATVKRYVEAYQVLAPLITKASGYYERQDYRTDNAAEGKTLHVAMVPAAERFLAERAIIERQMRVFSGDVDRRDLAAIEAREGKGTRWHIRNTMIAARTMMDVLPDNAKPVVDMKSFDETLSLYAAAVRGLDEYGQLNPGKLSSFENMPRSLLGKLREYREALARAKGDGRRARADTTWIINDFNMMNTISQTVVRR